MRRGIFESIIAAPIDRAENLATYNNAELPHHPDVLPATLKFVK